MRQPIFPEINGMTCEQWERQYDQDGARVQAKPVQDHGPMSSVETPTGAEGRAESGFNALVQKDTRDALNLLRRAGYACFATPKGELAARIVETKLGAERDEQKRTFGALMVGFLHKSEKHRACALSLLRDGWRPHREPQTELF